MAPRWRQETHLSRRSEDHAMTNTKSDEVHIEVPQGCTDCPTPNGCRMNGCIRDRPVVLLVCCCCGTHYWRSAPPNITGLEKCSTCGQELVKFAEIPFRSPAPHPPRKEPTRGKGRLDVLSDSIIEDLAELAVIALEVTGYAVGYAVGRLLGFVQGQGERLSRG